MDSLEARKEAAQWRRVNKEDDNYGNRSIEPKYILEYDEVVGVKKRVEKRCQSHYFYKTVVLIDDMLSDGMRQI